MTWTDLGRYGYDSNGNQTSRPGHRLTYTPFNKIRTIVDDGGQEVASNVYDADESRAIRRDEQGTTVYVGGLYERQTTLSGTVHHKFYISGPDGVVAEVRRTEGESLSQEFYPIKDRMGSPFVITDGDGNVVQRQTFSAFGGVKAWDPKGEGAAAPDARMNLGYTGHEAQDSLGLIDMGGRTYDPLVARFLQADIFVQYPYNLQSFNRYTYGMNNPFRYLDPSGYASEEVDPPSSSAKGDLLNGSDANSADSTVHARNDQSMQKSEFTQKQLSDSEYGGSLTREGNWDKFNRWTNARTARKGKVVAAVAAVPAVIGAAISGLPALVSGCISNPGACNMAGIELAEMLSPVSLTGGAAAAGAGAAGMLDEAAETFATFSGILRDSLKGRGNFGLGAAKAEDAMALGKAWVDNGYRIASDGKTLLSKDGLRQFRPPSFKPRLNKFQANFEQRSVAEGAWGSNGHLDIVDLLP